MWTRWARRRAGGGWPLVAVLLVAFVLVVSGQRAFGAGSDPAADPTDAPSAAASEAPSPKATEPPTPKNTDSPTPKDTEPPSPKATESASPKAPDTSDAPTPSDSPSPSSSPAPSADPTATPSEGSTADPTATPADSPTPTESPTATETPTPTPTPEPEVLTGQAGVLGSIAEPGAAPVYVGVGEPLTGAIPFEAFRFDVLVENRSTVPLAWTPKVEYRIAGTEEFLAVPRKAMPGVPLHTYTEWVKAGGGTDPGPTTAGIPVEEARLTAPEGMLAVPGRRVAGPNPDALTTLAPGSVQEEEFSLELSIAAEFGSAYELRISNDGTQVDGLPIGTVVMAGQVDSVISPGQRSGSRPKEAPAALGSSIGVSFALHTSVSNFTLRPQANSPVVVDPNQTYVVGPNGPASIHQPFSSTTSTQCVTCHSAHRGESRTLLQASSQTSQCYLCHGTSGQGGTAQVQTQFEAGTNDPSTRSYYTHDLTLGGHTLAGDDEFGGTSNRHSQCSDCHNSHNLGNNPDTYDAATSTWSPSGSYGGVTGVAVTNGAAGTEPAFRLLDGVINPVTAEYQLCFKCHSGYTTLPGNDASRPSRDFTDLAKAFNPNNSSYHPVEAAGRNQTAKMADSLAGTSQYKIWKLATTDTIRCVMCHTSGSTSSTTAPDATLPAHGSANRGILVRPYEDRVLSSSGQFYNPAGFALCLTCHAETPFANRFDPGASTATNFVFHGLHTSGIANRGSGGTDIDTAGAGEGNALCAECHFRNHGTTDVVPGQTISGDRLVNFAPDVTASKAMKSGPTFTKTATGGTCTLTCHGKDHQEMSYAS